MLKYQSPLDATDDHRDTNPAATPPLSTQAFSGQPMPETACLAQCFYAPDSTDSVERQGDARACYHLLTNRQYPMTYHPAVPPRLNAPRPQTLNPKQPLHGNRDWPLQAKQ